MFGHLTYVCVWGAILGNMNKEHESNKVISHYTCNLHAHVTVTLIALCEIVEGFFPLALMGALLHIPYFRSPSKSKGSLTVRWHCSAREKLQM